MVEQHKNGVVGDESRTTLEKQLHNDNMKADLIAKEKEFKVKLR